MQTLSPNGVLAPLLEIQQFTFLQTEENCQGEYFYYFEYFFFPAYNVFQQQQTSPFLMPFGINLY